MTDPAQVTSPALEPYASSDYARAFQAMMPRGRAWPRNPGSLQSAVVAALVPTYQRNDAAACALIADIFPTTTGDLLPDWESTLGLPDPCQGAAPTIQARVAQVVARFIAGGSPTAEYYLNFAQTLGFTATINQFTPWRFGQPMGEPLYTDEWAFAWQVLVTGVTTTPWQVLQCELNLMAPAHTIVVVTAPATYFHLDSSILGGTDVLA